MCLNSGVIFLIIWRGGFGTYALNDGVMNVSKKDLKWIAGVVVFIFLAGFILGRNTKRCPVCDFRTIVIEKNEKIIDKNTAPDSAWAEWQRRNGSKK